MNAYISFKETARHTITLKSSKREKIIAVVKRTFAQEEKESLDRILEKLITMDM